MKTKIIVLCLMLLSAALAYADGESGGIKTYPPPNEIPFNPIKPRPKSATQTDGEISCWYADGVLTISFEEPEGRATLKVTRMDDGAVQSTSFYTISTFTYTMGTTPGTYVLNLKTSQCEYEGYLTIE